MTFDQTQLSDEVLDALDAMNFQTCTPVQEQAIPIILEGSDLLAVAQTGTGKTAAYLLPIMDEILGQNMPQDHVNCLVMVPTRELAIQIDQQLQGFAYFMPISSIAVYGGTDGKIYGQQERGMTSGADIVIATPGRLLAHLAMGKVDLSQTTILVLDEADRMLDMGFYDDIMQIVGRMPRQRQTLMFSATMPPNIERLAQAVLTDPRKIQLSMSKPADKIRQLACQCGEGEKERVLLRVLREKERGKTIVFAASKLKVKDMSRTLRRAGIKVAEMHSDLDQAQREQTMRDFKAGNIKVLVATDIVARGIDIDNVELVVNYDVPRECEDYVHRVGRTARADADGTSLTLVSPRDMPSFRRIEHFLGKHLERISGVDSAPQDSSRPDTDLAKKNPRDRRDSRRKPRADARGADNPDQKRTRNKKRRNNTPGRPTGPAPSPKTSQAANTTSSAQPANAQDNGHCGTPSAPPAEQLGLDSCGD